jgi:hypothetical protein
MQEGDEMKTRLVLATTLVLVSAMAQRSGEAPRSNHGQVPAQASRREPRAKPQVERSPAGHVNSTPHVRNNQWYGHDTPRDKRYQLSRPFDHGRFEHLGPSYRYNIVRIDAKLHRFWLPGGFIFEIAAWDWPLAVDWCWTCGDDFVVYEDVDHIGWYMLYNIHTGLYVHARYMGL